MPTSVLIGSRHITAQTWSVTTNSVTEDIEIPAGEYYLSDPSSALSYCTAVAAALNTHSEMTLATCYVSETRQVRITASPNTAIVFTDTDGSDFLGYNANLSSGAAHVAPLISDYLWSPGKPESPLEAILGVPGRKVKDTRVGVSGLGGRMVSTHNDTRMLARFVWRHVVRARYWTTDELGGEFVTFWDMVLSGFARWKLYRDVVEGSGTSAMDLTDPLGPYKIRPPSDTVEFDIDREVEMLDLNFSVNIPAIIVPEIE